MEQELRSCSRRLNTLVSGFRTVQSKRTQKISKPKSGVRIVDRNLRKIGLSIQDINDLNVIHVAGTKGKGGTSAFTESILRQFGYKTGLFTSPHNITTRERIRICGEPLSDRLWVKHFNYTWDKLDSDPDDEIGYFQFLTLLSYRVFKEEGTEVCIYETGVGGENDATNIVSQPVATGITKLGTDHIVTLGRGPYKTLHENIAWHKSGIFKQRCPAFTTFQEPEFRATLKNRAVERDVHLTMVGIHPSIRDDDTSCLGTEAQKCNATLAVSLANTYRAKKSNSQIPHDEVSENVRNGLRQCRWDGRFQTIDMGPCKWYVDAAHNELSIQAAGDWFSGALMNNSTPTILIFNQQSILRDGGGLLRELYKVLANNDVHIDHAIFSTDLVWKDGTVIEDLMNNNVDPDAVSSLRVQETYADIWRTLDENSTVTTSASIEEAIKSAQDIGAANGIQTLITGSPHLVGGALYYLNETNAETPSTRASTKTAI